MNYWPFKTDFGDFEKKKKKEKQETEILNRMILLGLGATTIIFLPKCILSFDAGPHVAQASPELLIS